MAASLNLACIIGNVGRDPELRETKDGKEVAFFSIATTESWRDKATGEKRERTEWHRVVVFHEGLVKLVSSYVHKGSRLYIQGNIQSRKWKDTSGYERTITEIILQNQFAILVLLDSKSSQSNNYEKMIDRGHDASHSHEGSEDFNDMPF